MLTIFVNNGILDADGLRRCLDVLRKGEILCYPTETFYALGIDFRNEQAVQLLYNTKGRTAEKNLPLIAADLEMVTAVCDTSDPRISKLAGQFWPGALTLVLPARDQKGTLAIRVSSHPVAHQLAKAWGAPIVSTSANRSGDEPVSDPDRLPGFLHASVSVLVHAGRSKGGLASTIVSLVETPGKLIREGAIPSELLLSLL